MGGIEFMFKKIAIALCVFSLQCNAYQFLSEEQARIQQTSIAKNNLESAQEAYFTQYNDCIERSKDNILNPIDFKEIKLTEKELKATLLYFSAKTYRECVGDLTDKYITAINVARNFNVPAYSINDDPASEKSIYIGAPLAIDEIKYLPDYLQIAPSKRKKIEKIPEIHKVFDISNSFNALNIKK